MTQVVSSISGLQVYAPSAGFAPTNSADVSAIASGYQVVSSTSTELYAGTAFLTGVNGAPVSASRAGQAANASMANSAYYDGTGRLISSLPDSSTVSAIASAYAESAASGKLDLSASSSFYTTANESGYVDSSYVDSAVSGKQDTLTFSYDADNAISSINGSALAGGGSVTGDYVENSALDSATARSATGTLTLLATGVSSISGQPLIPTYLANPTYQYGGQSTFVYMPASSIWTTADDATGIFSPLQYATGACLAMDAGYFKAYYKGNEWFVTDSRYGYARGEVHQSRGSRVIVEHTGHACAVLSAKNADANVTLNNDKFYGTAKMAVASSQAYVQVQRGNSASKYNSAKLDTDYLKFYNGMATGYLDPEDTASGTAYLPAETQYMYISSIPYWNAKLDASAIECDTASAITAIGGSSVGGGVDEATVSAIASAYQVVSSLGGDNSYVTSINSKYISATHAFNAEFAKKVLTGAAATSTAYISSLGGIDSATCSAIASAYAESSVSAVSGNYYSTSNPSGFITGVDLSEYATTAYVDSSVSGKLDTTAFNSGDFYSTSNPSGFITGVDLTPYQEKSAMTAYQLSGDYAYNSSVSGKQDSSAMTAYVDKTAYDELYSSYTGLSALVSQYSGWFNELSSISAKVDNSAIGVIE